jgi:hypothetical protein
MFKWLQRVLTPAAGPQRPRRPVSYRPQVETLEDRTVPTSGAHFFSASASIVLTGPNQGDLVVQFVEAGLGNATVNYTLSGNESATYAYVNKGGNLPQAPQFTNTSGDFLQAASFQTKNGKVRGAIQHDVPPPDSDFVDRAPKGLHTALVSVSYTDVLLTDTTNGVSIGGDGSLDDSHTFIS